MSQDQKVLIESEIASDKFLPMKRPRLWIGVLALMILAIWAFGAVSAYEILQEAPGGSSLTLNPELFAARRYAEAAANGRERDDLADNPELSAANPFSEKSAADLEDANLYQNPGLKMLASQPVILDRGHDSDFLPANPELSVVRRHVETRAKIIDRAPQSPYLENVLARRYAETAVNSVERMSWSSVLQNVLNRRYEETAVAIADDAPHRSYLENVLARRYPPTQDRK